MLSLQKILFLAKSELFLPSGPFSSAEGDQRAEPQPVHQDPPSHYKPTAPGLLLEPEGCSTTAVETEIGESLQLIK